MRFYYTREDTRMRIMETLITEMPLIKLKRVRTQFMEESNELEDMVSRLTDEIIKRERETEPSKKVAPDTEALPVTHTMAARKKRQAEKDAKTPPGLKAKPAMLERRNP